MYCLSNKKENKISLGTFIVENKKNKLQIKKEIRGVYDYKLNYQ